MNYIKNFKITHDCGLQLIDKTNTEAFIKEKVEYLSQNNNLFDENIIQNFIKEFIDMYVYDIQTSTFDLSEIEDTIGFDFNKMKENMIMFYDIVFILGEVFKRLLVVKKYRISQVMQGDNGVVNIKGMLCEAYGQLLYSLDTDQHFVYGATLSLITLFEHDLKLYIKTYYSKKWLIELYKKILNGDVILSNDEDKLFDFLLWNTEINKVRKYTDNFDGVVAKTTRIYDLLYKYNIIDNDNNKKNLLKDKITLTQLLKSTLCKDVIDESFHELFLYLFDSTNNNLRNNLAHCNFGYMNYYHINVTALLCGVFMLMSQGKIFNDEFTK
jgi:hypothetical protein